MKASEFIYIVEELQKEMRVNLSSFDISLIKESVLKYKDLSFARTVTNLIYRFNTWNGFSIDDIGELTRQFDENKEKQAYPINRGKKMLRKAIFDKQIKLFQMEFELEYGKRREDLLFCSLNYLTEMEFYKTLVEMLTINNKDNLPTVRQITSVAYKIAPEAIKEGQLRPVQLKLA